MTINPLPNEHRDIFHGPATETNLELHFKGSNAKKAFDILKQHPKHIVSLYYEQGINAIIGHLIVEMYCTNVIKTLKKVTSFDDLVLTKGRYEDALESENFNRNANDIINLIIIEHYQNDYKGQLFKTNDKEYPIVSNIKDYLTKKDATYGLYIERTADNILSYTRYGKDKKERICLYPIDRHFSIASYAKSQEKAHITGTATNQNLTVILESNYPHEVLDYLKNFPEQLIDAKFQRPLKIIKTTEIIVNLHTENLEKTLTMLTNCPKSLIMVVYDSRRFTNENIVIAQSLLKQFKDQQPNDSFIVQQKETGTQKTYDTFPSDIDPQTIRHIEQTASALYYQTLDETTVIFPKEKKATSWKLN